MGVGLWLSAVSQCRRNGNGLRRLACVLFWVLGLLLPGQPLSGQAGNIDAEIVYLDAQGYIRILDPLHTNSPAVEWVSPVGGWLDFALGDFNGDGDQEIVAIKGGEGSGQLAIYDPVIATGLIEPGNLVNGIPWRLLYATAVAGAPILVAAGELDPTVAGDEVVYTTLLNTADEDDTNDETVLITLHATDSAGRTWAPLAEFQTTQSQFTQITVGELDGTAPDEIVLVDKEGALAVYQRQAQTFTRIFNNESESRPWQTTTIARFFSVGWPGLVASRSTSPGSSSFLVFVYEPGNDEVFRDAHDEFFLPAPEHFFAGDINGNNDEEVFFLRSVPNTVTNLMRLVMRNRGIDQLPAFELPLDTDNGYQGGAAADIDGDGRAEVIIMRDNKIRTYNQPEINTTVLTEYTPPATTNGRTLRAGNLDQNGYIKTPAFGINPAKLEGTLAAGEQSSTGSFALTNSGDDTVLPFSVYSQGSPSWLRLTGTTGQTPGAFSAAFDARLLASGVYTTTIVVTSGNTQVNNAPLLIGVQLTVRAGLTPRSLGIVATAPSCAADAPDLVVPLTIDGPTGMTFVAKIVTASQQEHDANAAMADTVANPVADTTAAPHIEWPSALSWVAAQSPNAVPTTMELTFHPQQLPAELAQATLQLTAADAHGQQVRRVPLILLCTQSQLYLPFIGK